MKTIYDFFTLEPGEPMSETQERAFIMGGPQVFLHPTFRHVMLTAHAKAFGDAMDATLRGDFKMMEKHQAILVAIRDIYEQFRELKEEAERIEASSKDPNFINED